jgi:hypothetical protein
MSLQVTVTWRQETDAKHAAAAAVTGTGTTGTDPTTPPSDEVDPPTTLAATVDGYDVTLTWTNGGGAYARTLVMQSPTSSFADAYQILVRNGAASAAQALTFSPGPGTWWWWIIGTDARGGEESVEVGPVSVTVSPDIVIDGNDP